ncbi:MAG TPA: 30S ribosomal protein S20 [Candidatus Aminicenantes bacterium]|nr:30S ribosomal protein S20 [Candidatus Aminicenantes bacterium]
MGETLRQTLSLIDKSVKKGTIRENTGNRYKSRLTKRFNAVATPSK